MPDTHAAVAKVILREVPLSRLGTFVSKLNAANVAADDTGHGCGLGCATGGIDSHGVSELTQAQLKSALQDKTGLKKALNAQIAAIAGGLK